MSDAARQRGPWLAGAAALTGLGIAVLAFLPSAQSQAVSEAQPTGAIEEPDALPPEAPPAVVNPPAVSDEPQIVNGVDISRLTPRSPLEELEKLLTPEELERLYKPVPKVPRERRGTEVQLGFLDRGLNKQSVRAVKVNAAPVTFGSLSVKVLGCYYNGPDDPPGSWAFLEVTDQGKAVRERLATLGPRAEARRARQAAVTSARVIQAAWVSSASPSIKPLDHPIYDVWVMGCSGDGGPLPGQPERPAPTRPATTDQQASSGASDAASAADPVDVAVTEPAAQTQPAQAPAAPVPPPAPVPEAAPTGAQAGTASPPPAAQTTAVRGTPPA